MFTRNSVFAFAAVSTVAVAALAPTGAFAMRGGFDGNTNGHALRPTWAHSRRPMDLMVSGIVMRLFQASQAASMMAL